MRPSLLFLLAVITWGQSAARAATTPVFFVGNSVTDTITYSGLQALAQSRGHSLPFGRHIIPGAPLDWIWDNSSSGFTESAYGHYPNALGNHSWAFLSLQPFDRSVASDLAAIRRYVDLALPRSPDLAVLVYARWPRASEDFDTRWARAADDPNGGQESKAFFEQLTESVRSAYPGRTVRMVPVGHVMHELNRRAKAGQVPGLARIGDMYTDGVHLDARGHYLVALTFFTTIFREDPRGLPVPPDYGTLDPAFVAVLQDTVLDIVAAHPLSGVVLDLPFEIGTSVLGPAIRDTGYSATLDANFGQAPFTWSVVGGTLPPGISLSSGGTLSGTATTLGAFSFTVRATDSRVPAQVAEASLVLEVQEDTIPSITTGSLPGGFLGSPYRRVFPGFQAESGNGALKWSLASGSLPPGLTLTAQGRLQGSPRSMGSFTFTVSVTDSDASPDSSEKIFTLTVGPAEATTLQARRIRSDVRIDGLADEPFWSLAQTLPVCHGGDIAGLNQAAHFDAVWDGAYLYVAVRVTDSELLADEADFARIDAVHLFLDALHDGEAVFNADDRQFAVCPLGRGLEFNTRGAGIVHAARRDATGYTVEIAVPWHNLALVPADNLSLGFDLVAADSDAAARGWRALGGTLLHSPSPAVFRDLLCIPTLDTRGARAGLLAEENFDYPAGALHARAGGSGWGAPWSVQDNNVSVPGYETRNARPLQRPGLVSSPGYMNGAEGYRRTGRRLDLASNGPFGPFLQGGHIGADNTTLWMAWLARRDGSTSNEVALHQNHVPWFENSTTRVSVRSQSERWVLAANGTTLDTGVASTAGQSFLMLLRLDYGATDTVTLYINPEPGQPLPPHAARITGASDLRFSALMWYPGPQPSQGSLDEIRIGTSPAAVLPTVETAPFVIDSPSDLVVRSGGPLAVRSHLGGSGLSIAWRRDGQIVPGRNDFALRFPAFARSDAGAYQVLATNRLGSASSSSFSLHALGLSIEEWRLAHFGDGEPEGSAANESSPAGDALPNLLKFALGLDPAQRENPPGIVPQTGAAGRALAFETRFDTEANGVALIIEGSRDLADWSTLATYHNGTPPQIAPGVQIERSGVAGEPGVDLIRVAVPVDENRYFFRARAEIRPVLP